MNTAEERISQTMLTALEDLADRTPHRRFLAWNTVEALEKRGLIKQDCTKYGLIIIVTIAGYHAIGRKHPYE